MSITGVGSGWKGTTMQRFWRKAEYDPETGCVVWIASRDSSGYGTFWNGERVASAHRFAFETLVGAVPEGMQLDHLCRTRACVNVAHLEVVTRDENLARGVRRSGHSDQTHCKHGHEFTTENTWIDKHGSRHCRACRAAALRRLRARRRAVA